MKRLVLLGAFVVAIGLEGCSLTREVRPVGKGKWAAGASVGGPIFTNLGAPIPTPVLSLYARYGLLQKLDLDFGLDLTPAAAQGLDLGLGYEFLDQKGPAPALMGGLRGYMFVNADAMTSNIDPNTGKHYALEPTAFEEAYLNVSWKFGRPWLLYTGVDLFAQVEQAAFRPSVLAGFEYRWRYVGLDAEIRQAAIATNEKFSTFEYVGIANYGAFSFLVGVNIYPMGWP